MLRFRFRFRLRLGQVRLGHVTLHYVRLFVILTCRCVFYANILLSFETMHVYSHTQTNIARTGANEPDHNSPVCTLSDAVF